MADRTADPPLAASLLFDDLTLRYQAIGRNAFNYAVIERYHWRNRMWQRSAPLAPSPEEFVMQWEEMSWEEAARWSRGDLSASHQQLKATTFEELYKRGKCGGNWVISGRSFGDNQDKEIYVIVEEAQPLDFRVLSVSDKPPDGCRLP